MTNNRTLSIIAAAAAIAWAVPVWAVTDQEHDSHHGAAAPAQQRVAAAPGNSGMGAMATTPGAAEQMNAMQQMHDRMMAATTPEERNALMAEQMTLMRDGMGTMGRMGAGTMAGKPGDMTACQGMLEQRMDMMQSIMQMMMDRMAPAPASK